MSKFILFSKINSSKPTAPNSAKWYQRISLNYFSLNIIALGVIIALFVCYIGLVNNTSAKGFTLDSLQEKLALTQEEGKQLDLQVQRLQSMDHIKTLSQNYKLEKIEDPEYLSRDSAVAFNE